jgi:hypothetical protein
MRNSSRLLLQQHLVQVMQTGWGGPCGAWIAANGKESHASPFAPSQAGLRATQRSVALASAISARFASTMVPLSKFEPGESLNERYDAMEKRLAVGTAAAVPPQARNSSW